MRQHNVTERTLFAALIRTVLATSKRCFTRPWAILGATTLCALTLAGCAANLGGNSPSVSATGNEPEANGAQGTKRTVKIALLLPLGGFNKTAVIAKGMKQAGEMALFERNQPTIELLVKDDKGTAEGAQAAAQEAISEGAQIILGPLFSKSVPGATTAARAANIPVVSFSNDRNVAGNGVYLMSYLPQQEVERIVSFAAIRGKQRFAALIPDTAYGRMIEQAFRASVARARGQVVTLERYPVGANNTLDPAKRVFELIKDSQQMGGPIDALFLPGGQETLPTLGPLITYAQLDPAQTQLLGTSGWDFPNIGRDAAFVGGWYPSPDPRGWQDFSGRFARNFGQAPPRLASLSYDAVNMAITIATTTGFNGYTPASLARAGGFRGVDGAFHFSPNGISRRGLAIMEVKKFGSGLVDPAPRDLGGHSSGSALGATSRRPPSTTTALPFGGSLFGTP